MLFLKASLGFSFLFLIWLGREVPFLAELACVIFEAMLYGEESFEMGPDWGEKFKD